MSDELRRVEGYGAVQKAYDRGHGLEGLRLLVDYSVELEDRIIKLQAALTEYGGHYRACLQDYSRCCCGWEEVWADLSPHLPYQYRGFKR